MRRYNPKEIEPRWQAEWEKSKIYQATEDTSKPKKYILEYFPYPSGAAMHVGHVRNYTIGDAIARYSRMRGYDVLHPMGWDAFGLPAENYALKNKVSPQKAIAENTTRFKKQLIQMGFSYDWSREINSIDPNYYKWTQWFFLLLYKKGLAYQKEALVNWDPVDKTVLANEQIIDGKADRSGAVVEKKALKQWFFKITEYADRLLNDLDDLDWSDAIKTMQRNWIGRSTGAEVDFKVDGSDEVIKVFTTRPDTLFGATFMVLAPEHPLVTNITDKSHKAKVGDYIKQAQSKSDIERQETERDKTGVFTGAYAINPVNNEKIPVWIADYVLYGYGTGAIMAVPAHDERDWAFAKKFDLPIVEVIEKPRGFEGCYSGEGTILNSGMYNGMSSAEARDKIVANLSQPTEDEPTFVDTFGSSAVREDHPFVERDAIAVIVKHWKEDKYIGLKWKQVDWETIITGGIEKGQTAEEAAIAEIREETGFLNPVLKQDLGTIHCRFFHPPKNVNRLGHFRCMYFELADGEHENIVKDEQAKHEVVWLTPKEMEAFQLPKSQRYIWDKLRGNPRGAAMGKVNYKIRDWLISRQRYWGAPIPIIHCPKDGIVPVPEDQLPVTLPELKSFEPSGDGRSPLANVPQFVNTTCPVCGGPAERETDTMDGFACSSWYFLRFADPHNNTAPFDKSKAQFWLPVDDYIGGAEHAVMHLLYARFWTKVMHDEGLIDFDEPFMTLRNQGMILAPDGQKMSKSKGNTIEPDGLIEQGYGADSTRIMELFIGPWNQSANWSVEGMGGSFRFLQRVWTLVHEYLEHPKLEKSDHKGLDITVLRNKTIFRVSKDLEELGFNTAIAALMEYVNELYRIKAKDGFKAQEAWQLAIDGLVLLLAPFAPHISEELWHELGHETSVHISSWPVHDKKYLVSDTVTIVVQVNGKVRANIDVPAESSEESIIESAKNNDKVQVYLKDKTVRKTVYVAHKLVSFVVS